MVKFFYLGKSNPYKSNIKTKSKEDNTPITSRTSEGQTIFFTNIHVEDFITSRWSCKCDVCQDNRCVGW